MDFARGESEKTGFQLSACVLAVFLPFIVAGYIFLGKAFTFKAAVGSTVYTLGLAFFEKIPFELNTEHFLAVAFGGAIAGENNTLICYISYFELPVMKEIISTHAGSFSTVSTIDEILR